MMLEFKKKLIQAFEQKNKMKVCFELSTKFECKRCHFKKKLIKKLLNKD